MEAPIPGGPTALSLRRPAPWPRYRSMLARSRTGTVKYRKNTARYPIRTVSPGPRADPENVLRDAGIPLPALRGSPRRCVSSSEVSVAKQGDNGRNETKTTRQVAADDPPGCDPDDRGLIGAFTWGTAAGTRPLVARVDEFVIDPMRRHQRAGLAASSSEGGRPGRPTARRGGFVGEVFEAALAGEIPEGPADQTSRSRRPAAPARPGAVARVTAVSGALGLPAPPIGARGIRFPAVKRCYPSPERCYRGPPKYYPARISCDPDPGSP